MHQPQSNTGPETAFTDRQTHVLKTSEGPVVTLTFRWSPFHYHCEWSDIPKKAKRRERVFREYVAWRDKIFEAAAQATKTCVMTVTPGLARLGIPAVTVYGKEFSKREGITQAHLRAS